MVDMFSENSKTLLLSLHEKYSKLFWFGFLCIRTRYGEILRSNAGKTDQKTSNSVFTNHFSRSAYEALILLRVAHITLKYELAKILMKRRQALIQCDYFGFFPQWYINRLTAVNSKLSLNLNHTKSVLN